jgi:hypothetical protein
MLALISGFGAGIAAWVTALNRIAGHDKIMADMAISLAATQATYKLLSERVEDIRAKSAHELAEFKLEVAKNYPATRPYERSKSALWWRSTGWATGRTRSSTGRSR